MMKKHKELKMRVTFEPNRISYTHIMDAYETLMPSIRLKMTDNSVQDKKALKAQCYEGVKIWQQQF